MKHFILNILGFVIVSLLLIIGIDILMLSFKNNWSFHSHEKNVVISYKKLQTLKNSNKIIIIAGSNGNFSINSKIISNEFKLPVVNTSSNAGFGIRMQFELYKEFIKKGDIIIFTPEYGGGKERVYGGSSTLRALSTHLPSAYSKISFKQWLFLHKFIGVVFSHSVGCYFDESFNGPGQYSDKSLNEYGDIKMERKHKPNINNVNIDSNIDNDFVEYVKYIRSFIYEKGAKFIFLPPTFMKSSFMENENNIEKLSNILSLNGIGYMTSPYRYSFSDTLYFDTPYHMTLDGANKRTKFIVEDMHRILTSQ